jgi:MoaA/NifB/PqqE/SkfB family radical SAM enzyme
MTQDDIDMKTFERTLDALPDLHHLELQGEGEPLLHAGFFEMAQSARDRGIAVSAITNGSLFNRRNIPRILESGICSLLVSIESPDPDEFRAIRGGRLEKITDGIRALLEARHERRQPHPALGFAFTLLRDTGDKLSAVADLYRQLGMDGGILIQQLSPMEDYARHYHGDMAAQCISGMERMLFWARSARTLKRAHIRRAAIPHFWDEILAGEQDSGASDRVPHFCGCPWLERGLYVDRYGVATACPKIKDTGRFALGAIEQDGREVVLQARDRLRRRLYAGSVPEPCRGCAIAESVVKRRAGNRHRPPATAGRAE